MKINRLKPWGSGLIALSIIFIVSLSGCINLKDSIKLEKDSVVVGESFKIDISITNQGGFGYTSAKDVSLYLDPSSPFDITSSSPERQDISIGETKDFHLVLKTKETAESGLKDIKISYRAENGQSGEIGTFTINIIKPKVKLNSIEPKDFPSQKISISSGQPKRISIELENDDPKSWDNLYIIIKPLITDQSYFEISGVSGVANNFEKINDGWKVYLNTIPTGKSIQALLTVKGNPLSTTQPLLFDADFYLYFNEVLMNKIKQGFEIKP